MFTLANAELTVDVLDPIADQERFGVRYCTGGYIYQIADATHGPLLTGPTFPDSFNWFDGQGIPDSFNRQPLRLDSGTQALVLGVGLCELAARTVTEFCRWEVATEPTTVRMGTTHAHGLYGCALERTVSLHDRTVRSATRVRNTGREALPISWFPHPFYPQPASDALCRLNVAVTMPENPGYHVADSGFISRSAWPSQGGFYQALDHPASAPLTILQRHPSLGLVAATTSYIPGLFPIWGNQYTFSFEPFFERTIAPGQTADWWVDYEF